MKRKRTPSARVRAAADAAATAVASAIADVQNAGQASPTAARARQPRQRGRGRGAGSNTRGGSTGPRGGSVRRTRTGRQLQGPQNQVQPPPPAQNVNPDQIRIDNQGRALTDNIKTELKAVREVLIRADALLAQASDCGPVLAQLQPTLALHNEVIRTCLPQFQQLIGKTAWCSQRQLQELEEATRTIGEIINAPYFLISQKWNEKRQILGLVLGEDLGLIAAGRRRVQIPNIAQPAAPPFALPVSVIGAGTGQHAQPSSSHVTSSQVQTAGGPLGARSASVLQSYTRNPEIQNKLNQAGTGPALVWGTIPFTDFISKEVLAAFEKFTGKPECTTTIHDVYSRLQQVHEASLDSVGYHRKMVALVQAIEGTAYDDIKFLANRPTEENYKLAWAKLFQIYGNASVDNSKLLNFMNQTTLTDASAASEMQYITELDNSVQRLMLNGQHPQVVYSAAWESILRVLPVRVTENRANWHGNQTYFEEFGDDRNYFNRDLVGHFNKFIHWMRSLHAANNALPSSSGYENTPSTGVYKAGIEEIEAKIKKLTEDNEQLRQQQAEQKAKHDVQSNQLQQKLQNLALQAKTSDHNQKEQQTQYFQNNRGNRGYRGNSGKRGFRGGRGGFVNQSGTNQDQQNQQGVREKRNYDAMQSGNVYRVICVFCGDQHLAVQCNLLIPQRIQHAVTHNMCQNCFAIGHTAEQCSHPKRCRTCMGLFQDSARAKHAPAFCQLNQDAFNVRMENRAKKAKTESVETPSVESTKQEEK